jgi:hypothetical protein
MARSTAPVRSRSAVAREPHRCRDADDDCFGIDDRAVPAVHRRPLIVALGG